jgi:4-hydroxybenzoate polyprenyltransferase
VIEYWLDRFVLSPFVPAAMLLALAAASSYGSDPSGLVFAWFKFLPIVLLALAHYRLWDDLADRERDRRTHPERTLCNAPPGPFIAIAVILPIVKLWTASMWVGQSISVSLLALDAALLGYYALRPSRRTALSDALLLAKYPVLVLALALGARNPAPLLAAVVATYAAALAYEIWHDPTGPLRANS